MHQAICNLNFLSDNRHDRAFASPMAIVCERRAGRTLLGRENNVNLLL